MRPEPRNEALGDGCHCACWRASGTTLVCAPPARRSFARLRHDAHRLLRGNLECRRKADGKTHPHEQAQHAIAGHHARDRGTGAGPQAASRGHVLGRRRQPCRRRSGRRQPPRRRVGRFAHLDRIVRDQHAPCQIEHRQLRLELRKLGIEQLGLIEQQRVEHVELVGQLVVGPELAVVHAHVEFRRRPGHLGRLLMSGITSTTALWYASRATGVVSLILLSAVMIIGMLVNRQGRLPGLPRFAVLGLHRNLSLLAVAFVAVHVLTTVTDSFVSISLAAIVIPFISSYEPLWLGLGAVSLDLMVAVIVTSLLRRHIGRRVWRAVHWLAYASWPVAVVHSIYSSHDMQSGPLLYLGLACIAAVLGALGWRLIQARTGLPRADRVPQLMADRGLLARAGDR